MQSRQRLAHVSWNRCMPSLAAFTCEDGSLHTVDLDKDVRPSDQIQTYSCHTCTDVLYRGGLLDVLAACFGCSEPLYLCIPELGYITIRLQ